MKTYYINEKIISLNDKYYVYDTNDKSCLEVVSNGTLGFLYRIFGSVFSLGHKLYIKNVDESNNTLSDSDTGNIFRGNKSKYIDIQWKNEDTLIIKYNCSDGDVFEKATEIKDINIEYLKV